MTVAPAAVFLLLVVLYVLSSIKILREYERAVIFRLGKLLPQPKGPGIVLVFAPIDRMVRVSLRTVVLDVPPQDGPLGAPQIRWCNNDLAATRGATRR